MAETLGQYVARVRGEKGITQTELARRIQYSVAQVSLLERDRIGTPGTDLLDKLGRALGVDRDEVYVLAGRVPEGRKEEFLQAVRGPREARTRAINEAFEKVKADATFHFGARHALDEPITEAMKRLVIELYEARRGVKLLPEEYQ